MYTVLLVDDDDADHYLCQQIFRRSGQEIELLIAIDGLDALEKIEQHPGSIDLILLDINMPRMNGHEFLAKYQERATEPIPIVAMLTSSDQTDDREQALRYECVRDYLLKPLGKGDVAKLVQVVDEAKGSQ